MSAFTTDIQFGTESCSQKYSIKNKLIKASQLERMKENCRWQPKIALIVSFLVWLTEQNYRVQDQHIKINCVYIHQQLTIPKGK